MARRRVALGDRQKAYESCYDFTLPRRLPMLLRIDGKSFHSMVKKWKCVKPFDTRLQKAMSYTAQVLCKEISGARLGYVQSDEITIAVYDDMDNYTQPWFDKRLNKILSVSAAIATRAFNNFPFAEGRKPMKETNFGHMFDPDESYLDIIKHPAIFDARAWVMPESDVTNNFIWRQQDASRNSVQMLARSLYSHKEVTDHKNSELQEMCFQQGSNWNDLPTWQKRGWCIVKKQVQITTDKGVAMRGKWMEDLEIPIFTQDQQWLRDKLATPEKEIGE